MSAPAPVFVLSAPFSGAPVLTAMLGRHPAFCALPELNLFMASRMDELLEIFRVSQGSSGDGLLRAVAQLCFGGQLDATIALAKAWLAERADRPVRAVLDELRALAAPRRLVVQDAETPLRPSDIGRMLECAPDARFLLLVRHPWSQAVVLTDRLGDRLFVPSDFKDHSFSPPQIDPQIPWYRANRNLETWLLKARPDACLHVTWEALISSPEPQLEAICQWLGAPAGASTVQAMADYSRWEFWGYGPPSAPYGLDPEALEDISDDVMDAAFAAPSLDGRIPWRPDGAGFSPDVVRMAQAFGYR